MDAKRTLFDKTLKASFQIENFVKFSLEIFNNLDLVNPEKQITDYWNWTEFSFHISGYYNIAQFKGSDNAKIAIFAVQLKDRRNLDRARSLQRNFVKKLMTNSQLDGAFVAFYADNETKWRLSFIKLDYEFEMGRVSEKITPAKRYSYLVGEGEPCHTAGERLFPIFMNEVTNPTISEIEEAFSVETVTKEFFEKYREKYLQLKEYLDLNYDFISEANRLSFTSEQFAKKLMGQIAFLYFIQKKGWLGVNSFPRTQTQYSKREYDKLFWALGKASREAIPKVFNQVDEDTYIFLPESVRKQSRKDQETLATAFKGSSWGTGPKDFIRRLFDVSEKNEDNFYDEYLEPLFYEALNEKREANDYYYRLNCRIPFLNGGLFEPLDKYDWKENNFGIPNDIFSNASTKGVHDADGILDVFDRYNFTMNEDEPLEKEVAVDPEMLGKIFENLLDVKDRKSKGAFYTPREIVHYMCQESIVNYLVSVTNISYEAIKDFIVYGEFMKDEDTALEAKNSGEMYISNEIFDFRNDTNRLKEIDDALADIRVADPAVGSGAFPLGMVTEIVKARKNITEYMSLAIKASAASSQQADYYIREMHQTDRHPWTLKRDAIKNSIFAVDIELSAIDITKLRLWLSLVVEQEINEENDDNGIYAESRNPRPLPNLDCNIRCGNSLVDELDGRKLVNESELFGQSQYQQVIGQNLYETLLNQLFEAQDRFFYERNTIEKEALKKKIHAITDRIVMFNLGENPELAEKYKSLREEPSLPFFVWQLEFARVYKEKGGFDVVIGNPPYIHLEHIKEQSAVYKKLNYNTYEARGDIYALFYERGIQLLRNNGILCYITSNKWMRAAYGKSLRRFFSNNTNPIQIIDFAGQQIFDATVDTNIILLSKSEYLESTNAVIVKDKDSLSNLSVYVKQNSVANKFDTDNSWTILSPIEQSIKAKIEAVGTPLKEWDIKINRGILTGCNEAFIITREKREEILSNCKTDQERDATAELIRPILRGRDIKRYGYEWANLYIIASHNGYRTSDGVECQPVDINKYPTIKAHLDKHWEAISVRTDKGITPYNLRNCAYMDDFSKQKIVYPDIMRMPKQIALLNNYPYFYYDSSGYFVEATNFLMTGGDIDIICAYLASELGFYSFSKFQTGPQFDDSGFRYKKTYLQELLIPECNHETLAHIRDFFYKLVLDNNAEDADRRINQLWFDSIRLSSDEIEEISNYKTRVSAN